MAFQGNKQTDVRIGKLLRLVLFFLVVQSSANAQESFTRWLTSFGADWVDGKKAPQKEPSAETISPGATIPSLWLPMCFFFEPTTDPKIANEKLQYLAQSYASCGIALKPYAFTMKPGYPKEAEKLLEAAKRICPIPKTFANRGAIQIETLDENLPKAMCSNPEAKGCSTLCTELSTSVVLSSTSKEERLHESMHSNCCGPVCVNEGEGSGRLAGFSIELASHQIATPSRNALPKANAPWFHSISAEGCAALQRGASANKFNFPYEPEKKDYYVLADSVNKPIDMIAGKSALVSPQSLSQIVPQQTYLSDEKSNVNENFTKKPTSPSEQTSEGTTLSRTDRAPEGTTLNRTDRAPAFWAPSLENRSGIPTSQGVADSENTTQSRERGASLRRSGDITRKNNSTIGVIDVYSGADTE